MAVGVPSPALRPAQWGQDPKPSACAFRGQAGALWVSTMQEGAQGCHRTARTLGFLATSSLSSLRTLKRVSLLSWGRVGTWGIGAKQGHCLDSV